VTIVAFLRRLGRKLQPPGNRGSLESEYLQPGRQTRDESSGPPAYDPGQTGV